MADTSEERVSKRQKRERHLVPHESHRTTSKITSKIPPIIPPKITSKIFHPYRTVGLVSPTKVPFVSTPRGKTTFQLTTSVGRSLQTYDLRRGLNLVFITRPQTPENITATAVWRDRLLAAWGVEEGDESTRGGEEHLPSRGGEGGGGSRGGEEDRASQGGEGDGEKAKASRGVWIFQRGKKVGELEFPSQHDENVRALCIFGCWIIGVCATQLLVWKTADFSLYTTLRGISPVPFTTCIASLPTFLNKIIVGRRDGSVDIWNVSSGKLLYTILPPSTAYGAVTALEPTPALDLVAISWENGPLVIHDVHSDRSLIQLRTPAGAPVTSISFRTDGRGAGDDGQIAGVMATASTGSGDITLWDLNQGGRRSGILRAAHAQPSTTTPGGTSRVEFLSGQSILVSSGLDNSLKTWIFDETPFNPVPRRLHERRGHGAPVTRLHFLPTSSDGSDDTGKWLLSGSKDRSLWGWSLRRDGQSTELSQGAVQSKAKKQGLLSGTRDPFQDLKCPPITSIACSLNRDGGIGAIPGKHPIWQQGAKVKQVGAEVSAATGWESILTAHENDSKARTWFWGRKRAGRWAFETGDGGNVSSIAMSPCGTFGVVGSERGGIDMFNMQSGLHRQRFPAKLTPVQAKQLKLDAAKYGLIEEGEGKKKFYRGQGKHGVAVIGLAVDALNKTIVSAGVDGRVKFWDFNTGLLRDQIDWSSSTGITSMRFHRPSDLAALNCTDGCIRVVDISTRKLIRELWPARHTSTIPQLQNLPFTDLTFSTDGHWIAACAGRFVFLWDLPTGHLVDAFPLRAPCASLAFSPTCEYLATATTDSFGVDIWTNRSLFTHVPTRHIPAAELLAILTSDAAVQTPTASGEGGTNLVAAEDEDVDEEQVDIDPDLDTDVQQLESSLTTLSLVPRSRWQNLLHIDLIRQRNQPLEPAKKPEKAPFFLPSLRDVEKGLVPTSDGRSLAGEGELEKERSRVLALSHRQGTRSEFTRLLHSTNREALVEHLKTLSPAVADVEIRSLRHEGGEFLRFVEALTERLQTRRDFEVVQVWMAVFLRVHGDVVVGDGPLRDAVRGYAEVLEGERKRLAVLVGGVRGLGGWVGAGRV